MNKKFTVAIIMAMLVFVAFCGCGKKSYFEIQEAAPGDSLAPDAESEVSAGDQSDAGDEATAGETASPQEVIVKVYVYNDTDGVDVRVDGAAEVSDKSGKVDINTATRDELMSLSGIGASKADAIITYRDTEGAFAAEEDIKKVSGIGESTFEKIKDQITV